MLTPEFLAPGTVYEIELPPNSVESLDGEALGADDRDADRVEELEAAFDLRGKVIGRRVARRGGWSWWRWRSA